MIALQRWMWVKKCSSCWCNYIVKTWVNMSKCGDIFENTGEEHWEQQYLKERLHMTEWTVTHLTLQGSVPTTDFSVIIIFLMVLSRKCVKKKVNIASELNFIPIRMLVWTNKNPKNHHWQSFKTKNHLIFDILEAGTRDLFGIIA